MSFNGRRRRSGRRGNEEEAGPEVPASLLFHQALNLVKSLSLLQFI
ncbi:hypothetical protein CHCC20375_2268 [Bacillus licheniformis]|nr:hypothetical protein CHCC20375_2268 [Bacillus licheniformis]TWK34457.1 hypothetical protein CHCC20369_4051 [Bacillus licheniformis]TWK43649.1 hypothetical protein CHCC20368_3542 [Bacillus licheniformis]TWK55573.1 hypothetical protein CHCC20344_4066 [Bacillus licheniformis]TWK67087.1 hypothetical protein CHCC20341_2519 [Bacillus licheniformis]